MYDLHRLRILRELKRLGTLAAVAEAMSYSPSSISQQLAQLESEVGVRLLEPVGRRVQLTFQAEILVRHTDVLMEELERAEAEIAASLSEVTGTVRIAYFQSAALALVPTAIARMHMKHPGLRIEGDELEPELALPALTSRKLDVAIAEEYPDIPESRPAELEQVELFRDELFLAYPATLNITKKTNVLKSLSTQPWAMEPDGSASRRWSIAVCRKAGFDPDIRFTSSDLLIHARLVAAGLAAAFLPNLVLSALPPTEGVQILSLTPKPQTRRIFVTFRRGADQHPAVLCTLETLVETAATLGLT